jgi:hypothetical protein
MTWGCKVIDTKRQPELIGRRFRVNRDNQAMPVAFRNGLVAMRSGRKPEREGSVSTRAKGERVKCGLC